MRTHQGGVSLSVSVVLAGIFLLPAAAKTEPDPSCCGFIYAHRGSITNIAISSDGKYLASGSTGDKLVKLWSLPDGALLRTLDGHAKQVFAVAFSPDGKLLASASEDKTVRLWSIPDGAFLRSMSHSRGLESVAFSPDSKMVAATGLDKNVYLWDAATGKQIKILEGHTGQIVALAFSPDGKYLASGGADKTIKLWSMPGGEHLKDLEGNRGAVFQLVFTPDSRTLINTGAGKLFTLQDVPIRFWSIPDGSPQPGVSGGITGTVVWPVVVSADGKSLFAGAGGDISYYSLPDRVLVKRWTACSEFSQFQYRITSSLAVDSRNTLLVSSHGSQIQLWSLPEGRFLKCLQDPALGRKKK